MLDESASLYCRSSFRSEIITVTCRDSRAHSRDYTKKLVICSCRVGFYTYSRTRSPTLSTTKTNIKLVNLKKRSEITFPKAFRSRTTDLHTTKNNPKTWEDAHMIIEIRPVRCFTSDGGRRGSKPDRQDEIGIVYLLRRNLWLFYRQHGGSHLMRGHRKALFAKKET